MVRHITCQPPSRQKQTYMIITSFFQQCPTRRNEITHTLIWIYEIHVENQCANAWWRHQMEPFSGLPFFANSPVTGEFPAHKGQWRGALMFSLICAWINGWVSNREAGDLRRHRDHYDVTVIVSRIGLQDNVVHVDYKLLHHQRDNWYSQTNDIWLVKVSFYLSASMGWVNEGENIPTRWGLLKI